MAESFTKLFSSIITSTVWSHDSDTKVVWVTLLALADKNGEVQGSVPGLARLAGVSVEACEQALEAFQAPDRYSRTKDHDGRRIEAIPGGWALLNYAKYRRMASVDDQKEKAAERSRRYRESKAKDRDDTVTERDASRQITEITGEAEAEAEDNSEANASGAGAPKIDPVKALFDDGVRLLTTTGTTERQARSLIGGWRKAHGDEATRTAIQAAYDCGAVAPVEYIVASLTRAPRLHETWDQRRIREAMEAIQ